MCEEGIKLWLTRFVFVKKEFSILRLIVREAFAHRSLPLAGGRSFSVALFLNVLWLNTHALICSIFIFIIFNEISSCAGLRAAAAPKKSEAEASAALDSTWSSSSLK